MQNDFVEYISKDDYLKLLGKKRNKYNAKKCEADGYVFDSLLERRRYEQLKLLESSGEIADLALHPSWPLIVNDVKIGKYTADFSYQYQGKLVVEDTKGTRTRDYVLRIKLMKALYKIDVKEIKKDDI